MGSLVRWCVLVFCAVESVRSWTPDRTTGQVWPLPRYINYQQLLTYINISNFNFKITNESCDILEKAVQRYTHVIKRTSSHNRDDHDSSECNAGEESLDVVEVQLTSPCEVLPHLKMDEHYELHVNSPGHEQTMVVSSSSVWGVLRGLETFSQLITPFPSCASLIVVNNTDILDYPSYPHRGLLLDTSRHYLPVSIIYKILAAMEMNKMNVFHWHIVDDESFPYESYTFPSLSEQGAYDPKHFIYSQKKVKDIVEFGRLRGIRVVPEFDSPGHTQSWGKGVSKLLTPCFTNETFNGNFGPIDPSRSNNYKFVTQLFEEIKNVFPENYIHIGGDEVDYTCWESNSAINTFMEEKNITTYPGLEGYYMREVLNIVNNLNKSGLVWQEVFQDNTSLREDTIVHIWTGNRSELLTEVTGKGNLALLSQGWLLDLINVQWENLYLVDPSDFNGTREQINLVLGGEACMWGEMVDETNIVQRIWPRASAVAERLWSSKKVNKVNEAAPRLNEHVCRMRRRGVAAQPASGPGFCPN